MTYFFAQHSLDIGMTTLGAHDIFVQSQCFANRIDRLPHVRQETAKKCIQDMLNNEIIEESQSPFILVDKKDGLHASFCSRLSCIE